MLVLGIETATARGSVAVVGPGGVLASRAAQVPAGHLEWLVPAIEAMLAEAGLARDAVDGLAVSIGPGGFSGLRIGLITATAWAVATGRPIAGISTLEVLAAGLLAAGLSHHGLVLAALDARREQVAGALFRTGVTALERLTTDLLARPEDLRAQLPALDEPVVLTGDALVRYHATLVAALAPHGVVAPPEEWWPRAEIVAAHGRARLLAGDGDDPMRLVPRYARTFQAKEFVRQPENPRKESS